MSVILTLNKKGTPLRTEVDEDVPTIWNYLNRRWDANDELCFHENREWIQLTSKGKPVIFNKHFIWKIE